MPSPRDRLPQVYDELRRLAAARVADEKPGHTLAAAAAVAVAAVFKGREEELF